MPPVIAVAKAIRTKPNTETKTRQSFPFCLLPSALCLLLYVVRQADKDLYEGLKAGEFCYVLNSRQMGKSSLRVQTMKRLQAEGIACAAVDLTKIGSQNLNPDQWYAGIVRSLVSSFELSGKCNLRSWWRERDHLSAVQRLSEFIEAVLLAEVTEKIEELVRSRVIENWESQDEPEHLRTIRDRILRNEQRAGRRLGLYQQILQQAEIAGDNSSAQMELQLLGLVVEQQGKLKVYNRIYASVFNRSWVDKALADLRPYGEVIAAWLASSCQEESWLLRGQALRDAQAWAATD